MITTKVSLPKEPKDTEWTRRDENKTPKGHATRGKEPATKALPWSTSISRGLFSDSSLALLYLKWTHVSVYLPSRSIQNFSSQVWQTFPTFNIRCQVNLSAAIAISCHRQPPPYTMPYCTRIKGREWEDEAQAEKEANKQSSSQNMDRTNAAHFSSISVSRHLNNFLIIPVLLGGKWTCPKSPGRDHHIISLLLSAKCPSLCSIGRHPCVALCM
jgi:hypothetical protein